MRPPAPWRPSKLRFEVEAQRSPAARMSGFMPRHIEQPASRHSKPARGEDAVEALVLRLALDLRRAGDDHRAHRARDAAALDTAAAARRSSMREFVHEPMKTRSTGSRRAACPARGPCNAARARPPRARPGRRRRQGRERGRRPARPCRGSCPTSPEATSEATSTTTSLSKTASESVRRLRHASSARSQSAPRRAGRPSM